MASLSGAVAYCESGCAAGFTTTAALLLLLVTVLLFRLLVETFSLFLASDSRMALLVVDRIICCAGLEVVDERNGNKLVKGRTTNESTATAVTSK